MNPYFAARLRPVVPVFSEFVVVKTANAVASTWAYDFWPWTLNRLTKYAATLAFDWPARLVPLVELTLKAGALLPNRLGKVVASQFASVMPFEVVPKLLSRAWPFLFFQK